MCVMKVAAPQTSQVAIPLETPVILAEKAKLDQERQRRTP